MRTKYVSVSGAILFRRMIIHFYIGLSAEGVYGLAVSFMVIDPTPCEDVHRHHIDTSAPLCCLSLVANEIPDLWLDEHLECTLVDFSVELQLQCDLRGYCSRCRVEARTSSLMDDLHR